MNALQNLAISLGKTECTRNFAVLNDFHQKFLYNFLALCCTAFFRYLLETIGPQNLNILKIADVPSQEEEKH